MTKLECCVNKNKQISTCVVFKIITYKYQTFYVLCIDTSDLQMIQFPTFIVVLTLFQSTQAAGHIKTAYADFNGKGIQGRISFTDNGENVQIETNFPSFVSSPALYHVHVWPVDYTLDPATRCGGGYVGGHYDPLGKKAEHGDDYGTVCGNNISECEVGDLAGKFGKLDQGVWNWVDSYGLSLSNSRSILFRSIVMHYPGGTRYTCATIMPDTPNEILAARARFNGPTIGGSIYFLQEKPTARDVTIFVDLFLTNSGWDLADNSWEINEYPTGTDGRTGDCGRLGDRTLATLTDRHGRLTFRNTNSANKALFTEYDGVRLYGPNRIMGRSIRIKSNTGTVLACGTIRDSRFIRAAAQFSEYKIEALQYSRFLPTHIRHVGHSVAITNQLLHTEGYFGNRACNSSLETYSPFSLFIPSSLNDTQDINDIGNLSSSLGNWWVWHHALPLSGSYSTIGRTVSIRRSGTWECADWQDDLSEREDNSYIYRARAGFSNGACWVWLNQRVSSTRYEPASDPRTSLPDFDTGDVTLFDYCPWGKATRQYTIQTRTSLSGDSSRYNPYWVRRESANKTEYLIDCKNNRAERCEVGDLYRLNLKTTRWTGIHTNLELLGEFGASYHIIEMTDSADAGVRETDFILPAYRAPFSVCVGDCNEAMVRGNELENPHRLASFACGNSVLNVCGDNEYEVLGVATGATNAEALANANTFEAIYTAGAGNQFQATFIFILLSLVLYSLLSY